MDRDLLASRHRHLQRAPDFSVRLVTAVFNAVISKRFGQDSLNIPTEPVGTIPRPLKLIEAIARADYCADPALDLL